MHTLRVTMEAKLIPVGGGKTIDILGDITLVGRKRGLCDLVVERGSVSKLHCLIVKTDGLLFIRDLGSTNGTKVNGQRVTRGALLPGDELAFASAKFRVHMGPGEPEVGPAERTEMLDAYDEQALYRHQVAPEAEEDDYIAGSDEGEFIEDDEPVGQLESLPEQLESYEEQLESLPEDEDDENAFVPIESDESASDVRLLSEDSVDEIET